MKRVTLSFAIVFLLLSLASCGGSSFIDDGNGHKQYKDSSGNFVKNDWAEIKGKKYFFDMNGYLVTNQWVRDEYYVDDKGAMQTNYWYDDKNGKMYYLGKDGKYVKDTIMTIDNNEYAFNTSGELVKNAPYASNGAGYYFGNDGKIDKTEGYKNVSGTYCYVKNDGSLLLNDWKEDEGKWYYFNDLGLMLKNSFVDGGYYVDENGEMVKDREIKIGSDTYVFDSNGQSQMKPRKINKKVNWIVKNPYATSYYTTTIHNDYNVKDENKKIKSTFNGSTQDVTVFVDAGRIDFKIYLFGDDRIKGMGVGQHEATMVTENGENIKIWYSSYSGDELTWGVILNGNADRENTYSKLIELLCKSDDTKYTIVFPNSTLSIKSEICPGNFATKYAPYKDKLLW